MQKMFTPWIVEELCMRPLKFKHRFVDVIPQYALMDDNVLYISIPCNVAVHKCACGCGQEVVTTISPSRWQLTYDGKTVTMTPSIGNWYFPCRSHYFIRKDLVVWADGACDNQSKPKRSVFSHIWSWIRSLL